MAIGWSLCEHGGTATTLVRVNTANRAVLVVATLVNSVLLTLPQIVALVVLSPTAFGTFALFSLAASLNGLLLAALVIDPWLRNAAVQENDDDLAGIAAFLATLGGTPALISVLSVTGDISLSLVAWLASSLTTLRIALRVREVQRRRAIRLLIGDTLGLVGLVAVIVTQRSELDLLLCLWLIVAGQVAPLLMAAICTEGMRCRPRAWLISYKADIRLLASDSLWGAVSGIGAPYALLPILGLSNFGTYRAISNLAAPVRLIVQPLKPLLPRLSVPGLHIIGAARILTIGLGMALLATGTLLFSVGDWAQGSALESLRSIALPAGLYFGFNVILQTYWTRARLIANGSRLRSARRWHLGFASLFPLIGGAGLGLDGAAWGLGLATTICAVVWWRANILEPLAGEI